MADLLDRLTRPLAHRYRLHREVVMLMRRTRPPAELRVIFQ